MSAMKRRSLAPVRPSELFEYRVAESAAEKKPIVPRQLNFTGNASRRSMFGRSKNFSSTGNATQRTRTSLSGRVSLSGKARQDVSVLDGVSLLGLTINESSDDVTIQNPKPGAASTSSKPVCSVNASQVVKKSDEAMTANGLKMCNTSVSSVSNKTFSSCYQSSSDLCETKIPKPKIHTTESTRKTSVEMNSTAAFEEEEIAALTSTPHPDRRSKSIVPLLSSTSENSELAEQMKLFIMDQRSLMQAVKLSCQKSTSAMEQMDSLMVQMNTFMGQMITLVEKLTLKVDPHAELNKLVAKSELCQNNDEIAVSDDKENVDFRAGNARRSISMFADMKSQLKCLKTPTTVKNRTLCETPNTLLSNTVHCQLESLYEGSETDT